MATRSLSLAAYRALSRRSAAGYAPPEQPRPAGELVWIHLGRGEDLRAILDMCHRLHDLRRSAHVLITAAPDRLVRAGLAEVPPGVTITEVPDEHPKSTAAFLKHWRPDLGVWIWGDLRPNLVDEAHRAGIPLHMFAVDTDGFEARRERWLPELTRHVVRCFQSAVVLSSETVEFLVYLGMAPGAVTIMPPLQASGRVLPCVHSDLEDMSTALGGRPVWFAANVSSDEWPAVLGAHRRALRGTHRLLLVLNPSEDTDLSELEALLKEQALAYANWNVGEQPTEFSQVLITDAPEELGLWYRIASVTFVGSTLAAGKNCRDPLEASALGSAVLYGPNVRPHTESFSRLARAGAARIVNDGESLGSAVSVLIAPDRAARMAHAGWSVVSESAEVVDSLIELVQDALDDPKSRANPP